MKLGIVYLYPDLMNIYGDYGNILCLIRRCRWRGIEVEVRNVSIGDEIAPGAYDLYFFGGGQDQQQKIVSQDLQKGKGEELLEAVEERGAVILSICGGYQLLGRYYKPLQGEEVVGVGLFDAYTVAGSKRMVGDIVTRLQEARLMRYVPHDTLVGFENHSGKTYLGEGCRPLAKVLSGHGNNGEDGTEGAVYKNAFGTYLHGSLLPKNPHLADHLIQLALKRRYGEVELESLDDGLEWEAHRAAISNSCLTLGGMVWRRRGR